MVFRSHCHFQKYGTSPPPPVVHQCTSSLTNDIFLMMNPVFICQKKVLYFSFLFPVVSLFTYPVKPNFNSSSKAPSLYLLVLMLLLSNLICIHIIHPGGTPIRGKSAELTFTEWKWYKFILAVNSSVHLNHLHFCPVYKDQIPLRSYGPSSLFVLFCWLILYFITLSMPYLLLCVLVLKKPI